MPVNYKLYHPDWRIIRRQIVVERAKNRCEQCGACNGMPHPTTGKQVWLACCHLDHDICNNEASNLRSLCNRCHLNHDRLQHLRSRKYGRYHHLEHQFKIELACPPRKRSKPFSLSRQQLSIPFHFKTPTRSVRYQTQLKQLALL